MKTSSSKLGLILAGVGCLILVQFTGLAQGHGDPRAKSSPGPSATLLASGLQGSIGSTIGPDGALYVTESALGRVSRVDTETGQITPFASGLPKTFGSPIDVTFVGETAYVLVTLVSPDVGGNSIDGIYRVDGPHSFTLVADIGQFAMQHPPKSGGEIPTGVLFALQPYRGGFLVTDGNHNRVYRVMRNGVVSELIAFDDITPTGLAVSGDSVYMAEAGKVPHPPEQGKIVSFDVDEPTATVVASGAPLLVDVVFGPRHGLYALSQGPGVPGAPEGSPAQPNTGSIVRVNEDGTFTVVFHPLDRPGSLEFIGKTAYVVTLTGQVWKIAPITGGDDEKDEEEKK